MGMKLDLSC